MADDETIDLGISGLTDAVLAGRGGSSFAVDLVAGQQVELLMRSPDADAYLTVTDADETVLASDDDSGGNLDAQLAFTAPTDGRYQLATSFLGDSAGSFSLGVLIR